jgi:hypothetical protein
MCELDGKYSLVQQTKYVSHIRITFRIDSSLINRQFIHRKANWMKSIPCVWIWANNWANIFRCSVHDRFNTYHQFAQWAPSFSGFVDVFQVARVCSYPNFPISGYEQIRETHLNSIEEFRKAPECISFNRRQHIVRYQVDFTTFHILNFRVMRQKDLEKWCREVVNALNISACRVTDRPTVQYPLQCLNQQMKGRMVDVCEPVGCVGAGKERSSGSFSECRCESTNDDERFRVQDEFLILVCTWCQIPWSKPAWPRP